MLVLDEEGGVDGEDGTSYLGVMFAAMKAL